MIEPALRVEGVRKSYGHVEVLKGIDMQVKPGEVTCLVGPSGSGKSTLIKAILNLPNIRKSGEWISSSKDIGYLDQHYNNLDLNSTLIKEFSNLVPSSFKLPSLFT